MNQFDDSVKSQETQQIELFVNCRQLDDMGIVTFKKTKIWIKIDETEVIYNSLNPNFVKTFQMNYLFQVQQNLKFEVHHYISQTQTKIIGKIETTVGEIIGSKNQIYTTYLINQSGKRSGKIIIKADQMKECNAEFKIQLSVNKIQGSKFWFFWDKIHPFLRMYRQRIDDQIQVLVYETESTKDQNKMKWKDIECQAQKLCNGDYGMQIKIELWDYKKSGKHKYIGETTVCINELMEASKVNKTFQKEFINKSQKNNNKKCVGILQCEKFELKSHYTFLDYCIGGQQLSLIVGIDFTASNENIENPKSLHYIENDSPSQYLQAIISVVEILINYDHDKRIPVYGFGCKPKMQFINTNKTQHIFHLNDNPNDPKVQGLDGIIQCYKKSLNKLQFDGPTYLHPILKKTMEMAQQSKNQGSQNYYVLLILTDGQTDDMLESIDDIIASSLLPLSIIIVGLGDANFKNMMILDNDNKSMIDSKGNKAIRDLVQFVPFNQFKSNPTQLSIEVLKELPNQLIEYMELVGIHPKCPKLINSYSHLPSNLDNYLNIQQHQVDLQQNQQGQIIENEQNNQITFSLEQKQQYLNTSLKQKLTKQ
ncbi:unnamed protein product [Paramecium sonneborni]|uniref:Uncharacterized protein n=1 Tax=Paramecium sonneborni TaxID=65129 RepID=A0A8S1PY44_9CILI|nr:unnamed protein product [Paramecium sonneborni]